MKPLSIQLYTVRDAVQERGIVSVLQDLARIGFKGVEGSGFGMTAKEFRGVVEDLGMVVSSAWGDVSSSESVAKLVDELGQLGTTYGAGGFWIEETKDLEAIQRTAALLTPAIQQMKAAGVTFGLHNHWMEFEPRGDKLAIDHLIDLCPELELELDIYWCGNFGANRPVDMVRKYRDRIPLMHVKDGPQTNSEAGHVAAGSGTVDVKACIEAANPDKLGWLILELDRCDGDMMMAVEDSYRYLVGSGLASGNKPA